MQTLSSRLLRFLVGGSVLLAFTACGGGGNSSTVPAAQSNPQPTSTPATFSVHFDEFAVPVSGNSPTDPHPGSWPDDLTIDDQGNIWFAEHHADEIGRLVPTGSGYVYHGYPVPTQNSEMDSIVLDKVNQRIWVSENNGKQLARLDYSTNSPQVVEFSVATASYPNPVPGDLTIDASGNPWFTTPYEQGTKAPNAVGMLNAASGQVSYFLTPTQLSGMDGITTAASGAIWFVELTASRIGTLTNGSFVEYPTPGLGPSNIAVDSNNQVWVTEELANAVAVFNPATATWREIPVPTPSAKLAGITIDASGNVWFTEVGTGNIGVIPVGTNTAYEFATPTADSAPEDIQTAPDGRVYFTERYGNKVGRATLSSS